MGKRFRGEAVNIKKELEKCLNGQKVEQGKKIFKINGKEEEFNEEIRVIAKLNKEKIGDMHSQCYLDKGVIILSDLSWDENMNEIYILRKITREIMNLRKKMKMVPTDNAKIIYKNLGDFNIVEDNLTKLLDHTNMQFEENNEMEVNSNKLDFEEEEIKYEFILVKI